jgi:hypothetical protein
MSGAAVRLVPSYYSLVMWSAASRSVTSGLSRGATRLSEEICGLTHHLSMNRRYVGRTRRSGRSGGRVRQRRSRPFIRSDSSNRFRTLRTSISKALGRPDGRQPPHARDISRAVNNFDRNLTRVLFGASNNAQQAPAPPPAAANEKKRQ